MNETFASLREKDKNLCALWHEPITVITAKDVICSFLKVIKCSKNTPLMNCISWMDNCSAQNKNWTLF